MAAHVLLKNEFTEDQKYHNLVSWLNWIFSALKGMLRSLIVDQAKFLTCSRFNTWFNTRSNVGFSITQGQVTQ